MKIIISFFAALFLAAMSFAQEESPSPAAESTAPATEEKASATVEQAPAAKPEESIAPAMKFRICRLTKTRNYSPPQKKKSTPQKSTKACDSSARRFNREGIH